MMTKKCDFSKICGNIKRKLTESKPYLLYVLIEGSYTIHGKFNSICVCSMKFNNYDSFFLESFNLWHPLLIILAIYYQSKTSINFWCRRN